MSRWDIDAWHDSELARAIFWRNAWYRVRLLTDDLRVRLPIYRKRVRADRRVATSQSEREKIAIEMNRVEHGDP